MCKNTLSFTRNELKYLAAACMLIDHIAAAFVPTLSVAGSWMHFFGRFTGPLMVYFIVEGYIHTHSLKRYIARMGLFAVISWPCYSFFATGHLSTEFGVIYTLFLGILAIWAYDKFPLFRNFKPLDTIWKWTIITALFVLSSFGDWAYIDVLVPLGLYILKDKKHRIFIVYGVAQIYYLLTSPHWFSLGFLVPAFLLTFCYNGKSGRQSRFN